MMHANVKTTSNIIVLLLVLVASQASAASFDCAKAKTKVEKTICASETLSALDEQLGREYAIAAKLACTGNGLRNEQKAWLAVRDRSPTAWDMARRYEERIDTLQRRNNLPFVVEAQIDPKTAKYKFSIELQSCIDHSISPMPTALLLTIRNPVVENVQTIDFEVGTFYDAAGLLRFVDMDGDGFLDFTLLNFYGAGPFPYSTLYRFDPGRREFIEDSSFPGGFQTETPAERAGCVYVEERADGGSDYAITEWCLDRDTNAWAAERTCSRVQDKECVDRIDAYRKKWDASHRSSK